MDEAEQDRVFGKAGAQAIGTVPTLPGWSTLGAACTPPVGCG